MTNLCATAPESSSPAIARLISSLERADPDAEFSTDLMTELEEMGLAAPDEQVRITQLGCGVSSDIFRVDLEWGSICVKRALPKLRVSGDWALPVGRSGFECEWLKIARIVVGESVPDVLGERSGLFAMEFLDPARHSAWKTQLCNGNINPSTAAEIGRTIGRIHSATANNVAVARRFASQRIFDAARVEPFFLQTAQAQPAVAARLRQLAADTAKTRLTLIHGDLTPKNVLVGPKGPVLIDAEFACHGDPAFDVALCLSHLLLKCAWRPQWRDYYLTCFDAFWAAYAQRVTWESPDWTNERAAMLVPALMLARVHGRLRAEYLQTDGNRDRVARFACSLLTEPVMRLAAVRESWRRALTP